MWSARHRICGISYKLQELDLLFFDDFMNARQKITFTLNLVWISHLLLILLVWHIFRRIFMWIGLTVDFYRQIPKTEYDTLKCDWIKAFCWSAWNLLSHKIIDANTNAHTSWPIWKWMLTSLAEIYNKIFYYVMSHNVFDQDLVWYFALQLQLKPNNTKINTIQNSMRLTKFLWLFFFFPLICFVLFWKRPFQSLL